MFRMDKMKEGLFEGYYQTLKYAAENYVTMNDRLKKGGMCLIPRTEIFRLVTKSSTVRERAYILKNHRIEKSTFRKKLGGIVASAIGGEVESARPPAPADVPPASIDSRVP